MCFMIKRSTRNYEEHKRRGSEPHGKMWQRVREPQGRLVRNEPKLHSERKLKGWEMKNG